MYFYNKLENETIKSKKSSIISFFKDLVFIFLMVFFIKSFLIVPFVINGSSMSDSYYDKEFIIVDKISYILGKPQRGDVIVFKPGVNKDKEYFLKRIIGIPGDTLKINNGKVYIKTKGKNEFVEINESYLSQDNLGFTFVGTNENLEKIYNLGESDYFVMGDNRKHSTDSRQCFSNCLKKTEFIKKGDMTGKVLLDLGYFNIKKLEFIHPDLGIKTFPRFFSSPSNFNYKELK